MQWLIENREWVFSGVGVAIAAGILAFLRSQASDLRTPWSSNVRIAGDWYGEVRIIRSNGELDRVSRVRWTFRTLGPLVRCASVIFYQDDKPIAFGDSFALWGRFVDRRLVRLHFRHRDKSRLSFGSELLMFDPRGQSFTGRFVAYSEGRKDLTFGVIFGDRRAP